MEKFDILEKKLEQHHLENETLTLEVNRLKYELATSQEKAGELEQQMTETGEMFNQKMENGGQKISPLKATMGRWREKVINKFDVLRKKLEQSSKAEKQITNEEILIIRRRLEQLDKESPVAFSDRN